MGQQGTLTKSVIDDFSETITVFRDDEPQRVVNGVIVPAATRELQLVASVQPMRGAELLMFPEGDRVRQTVKLYSYDELKIIDEAAKLKADYFEYNNTVFEVVSVERWFDADFIYYKSIARRKDRQ